MIRQGDIIWLDLDPQSGQEQKGRRPVVVISNNDFHMLTGNKLAMVCPITNNNRGFVFDIALDGNTKTTGVIMVAQTKILDIKSRNYKLIERLPEDILSEVLELVESISRKL